MYYLKVFCRVVYHGVTDLVEDATHKDQLTVGPLYDEEDV